MGVTIPKNIHQFDKLNYDELEALQNDITQNVTHGSMNPERWQQLTIDIRYVMINHLNANVNAQLHMLNQINLMKASQRQFKQFDDRINHVFVTYQDEIAHWLPDRLVKKLRKTPMITFNVDFDARVIMNYDQFLKDIEYEIHILNRHVNDWYDTTQSDADEFKKSLFKFYEANQL